jgi:hypothetical protein
MKVKEIRELEVEKLIELMTDEEWKRMQNLKLEAWQLLDAMQDGVRESDMEDDEEYSTISEYLDYIEEMRSSDDIYENF